MRKLSLSPTILKKAGHWLGGTAAVVAVAGFLILPAVLKPVLERKLADALHRSKDTYKGV